jgi:glycosyltransferase involved in cell wall biosynthesis
VIALLVDGLVERGHDVVLVAHRESRTSATLMPYPTTVPGFAPAARRAMAIGSAARTHRPDVIQSFGRLAALSVTLPWTVPKVMSYQRMVTPRSVRWARRLSRQTIRFTGCSRSLIQPVATLGEWQVIYNAVPLDRYTFVPAVSDEAPLVFLGRVERIKGTHLAIDIARRVGRRLLIAGNLPDDDAAQAYFRDEVSPHLDGRQIQYVGPVDDRAKNDLLGGAAALLMPILWDEPFGIVMAEALACGTPVLGFDRGAVPEVIADGVTGFVAADVAGLADRVLAIRSLDRRACRQAAEQRFSPTALVDAYERIYDDCVHHVAAPARAIA